MSNLEKHAEEEMKLAGLFDSDADYNGKLAPHVMELIKLFASARHSGMSASITRELFYKLSNFENLTPVRKEDFVEVSVDPTLKQCRRNSALFLNKEGDGYYSVNDKNRNNILFAAQKI